MRSAEIAVGLTDGTWITLNIDVPEDPDDALSDEEIGDKAIEMAEELGDIREGFAIAFYAVLYVEPVEDPLEGIV